MASPAAMSSSLLSIELVGTVLEHAARIAIDNDSYFALDLLLVPRITHSWLLPVIYSVFVVRCPQEGVEATPSLAFLLRLSTAQPHHSVRQYIRHIVFILPEGSSELDLRLPSLAVPQEWDIDSVAGSSDVLDVVLQLQLRPRSVFITDNDDCAGIMFAALVMRRLCNKDPSDEFKAISGRLQEVMTPCVIHPPVDEEESTVDDVISYLTEKLGTVSEEQSPRTIHLRVILDLVNHDSVASAARLFLSLLRYTRVMITCSLPRSRSVDLWGDATGTCDTDSTVRALCDALASGQEVSGGDYLSEAVRITFKYEEELPKTVLDYARAVRSGRLFEVTGCGFDDFGVHHQSITR